MRTILSLFLSTSLIFVIGCSQNEEEVNSESDKFRIGVITFLSGPASGPFGVPAKNAADLLVEAFNSGNIVPGYESVGFAGKQVELVYVDEAGGPTKVVNEFRTLVNRQNVDMIIGVISSGDCLAVAPVAEELKAFTVLFDCSTNRIFEENDYKYVFRTSTMATQENVAAARYIHEKYPNLKYFSGVNPNYAWGVDSWRDFTETLSILNPSAKIKTNVTPKLLVGQYGTEISALISSSPEIVQNSLWGGDLEAFILQSEPRNFLNDFPNIMTCGETVLEKLGDKLPDGTIIGARGPNGPFAPDSELNNWFRSTFIEKFDSQPVYSAYHMASAFLGAKAAWDKALTKTNDPTIDDAIASFEYLKFESVSGNISMDLGKGHQAVQHVPYGTIKNVNGKYELTDVIYFEPELISPPDGVNSADWIKSGFKND